MSLINLKNKIKEHKKCKFFKKQKKIEFYGIDTSAYEERILEIDNSNDSAIVFYKNQDLETIANYSGMANRGYEYQVHYIALVMIQKHIDGSKELTIFPIAYYNYPQKVTSVTIDVEMNDVAAKAQEIQQIAMVAAKELIDKLQIAFPNQDLEFHLSLFNNIHRHP